MHLVGPKYWRSLAILGDHLAREHASIQQSRPVLSPWMNNGTECKCHRLAVSLSKTLENDHIEAQFRKAILSITTEEYEKVARFRYKDDALASLLGRLFLRQATRRLAGVDWSEIEFGRTEKGKPFLAKPPGITFGINVSHQGDYVAFASSCTDKIGVDCMRLDKDRNNKSADEYINSMAKSASVEELRMMRSQATEQMKMTYFYRYWCLKEAVLKATGEGLLSDLRRLDFRVDPSERYRPRCFITSTTVSLDGKPQNQWIFEETFIDDRHAAAVCREKKMPKTCSFYADSERRIFFGTVDMDFLIEGATVLNPMLSDGAEEWRSFNSKPRKNF
uniref:L-aminoadipate-semialdehyde dehydrogenase-phosphopantetheinyl transferase n=1 Tax=Parascaris univalens TaxID=6257 RepID=A0A915A4J4_PARUN